MIDFTTRRGRIAVLVLVALLAIGAGLARVWL